MATLLYIDPGTGSMLFSILIGATATLFFLGKAAWLKIKLLFTAKKNGVSTTADSNFKKYVIYNEGIQYWNTFKPICDEFEKRQLELTYYTSAQKDPCFDQNYKYVKPEFIGEGNLAFVKLNMLSAGFVLMTTPGLNVYQLKRSKNVKHYSHIIHMTTDTTMYRLFGTDYYDSVLVTGDYHRDEIQYLENHRDIKKKQIITVGCPYLDVLKDKMTNIKSEENHTFTVLVSPTWGASGLLAKYGERLLDPLVSTGWNIIVRPHPQSKKSEKEILDRLTQKYKDTPNLVWDYETDNIYSLKKADIMISDFSGIIFDYAFLCNKPVIYVNSELDMLPYDAYDLPDHGKDIWLNKALKEIGIELKEEFFANIKEVIEKASQSKELEANRQKAKNEAWMNEGHAGEAVVDFMVQEVSKMEL